MDGDTAWVDAGNTEPPAEQPRGVRLLPYFDAYGIGCHPRDRVFPGRAAQRALARGQAGNYPLLLIDGVVAGVWHQRRSGRRIDVTVEALDDLSRAQREQVAAEAERVAAILEASARLAFGPISVGPHA